MQLVRHQAPIDGVAGLISRPGVAVAGSWLAVGPDRDVGEGVGQPTGDDGRASRGLEVVGDHGGVVGIPSNHALPPPTGCGWNRV